MRPRRHPITEHPGPAEAVIEPARLYRARPRLPEAAVLCYFGEAIAGRAAAGQLEPVAELPGEGAPTVVFRVAPAGAEPVALCFPGVGAPQAAATLEELVGLGVRRVVCVGGAGVLDGSIAPGTVVLPVAALRCEGTSYHYQRRGRWARRHPDAARALEQTCRERGVPWLRGRTWTTDAVYRETPAAVRRRRAEGCLTVEMEAAALFAVARFRAVRLAVALYAGDDVSGTRWRHRGWTELAEVREGLLDLALEAVRRIP